MSAGTWPFCSLGSDDTYPYAAAGTEGLVNPTANKQRICVIGAGPTGLAALKIVADAPQFKNGLWEVVAFEAREAIGGLWYVLSTAAHTSTDVATGTQHCLQTTHH